MNNRVRVRILDDTHYIIRRLSNKGINIYNIEYEKDGNIYTIDLDDVDKLPSDVEVLSFNGIRGLFFYLKRHMLFIISILLSIGIMFFLNKVVVKVEVIHNDKYIREIVTEELDKYGIHPIMFKKSFKEIQEIKEHIKSDLEENIEWLEIIDDGMKYTVRVEERIITKKEKEKKYCDIISTKDAILLGGRVSKGQALVDPNDYVKKDSVLVSGAIKFNEEIKAYTCAEATIYGNTWYRVAVSVPYEHTTKKYTGKKSYNISFEYGSKKTGILKVHFKEYDNNKVPIFNIGKLTIYKETNREYTTLKEKYGEEEIVDVALKKGREKILVNLDDNASIISEKVLQSNLFDSIIEMDIFYSVKEIISRQVERDIPEDIEVRDSETTE